MIGIQQFVIDIDGTILWSEKKMCPKCGNFEYKLIKIDKEEIKRINKLYKKGHRIILHTARNWACYPLTIRQLKEIKIKYHELIMGKPPGIVIDKDAEKSVINFL